jgi:hypothetical protein
MRVFSTQGGADLFIGFGVVSYHGELVRVLEKEGV